MRTLHELYCILWEEIKDKERITSLCYEIDSLYYNKEITRHEWGFLAKHFKIQKPSDDQHTDFTKHPHWVGRTWWWKRNEDFNPTERKRFVQLQMELTK